MERWARIGEQLAALKDWRRYAPAAGSTVAHVAVLVGLAALTAAASKPGTKTPAPMLSVTLVSDVAPRLVSPPEPMRPAPPTRNGAAPLQRKTPALTSEPEILPDPSAAPSVDTSAPAIAPPIDGVPAGLRTLMVSNPCRQVAERLRAACTSEFDNLAKEADKFNSEKLEALARKYPEFMPNDGRDSAWMSLHRYRRPELRPWLAGSVNKATGVMPGGPAGGTGIESVTGRLPHFNWQTQDPAFEVQDPSWIGLPPVR